MEKIKDEELLNLLFGEYDPPCREIDNYYKIYGLPIILTLVFIVFIIIYKNNLFKDISGNDYIIIFILALLFFIICIVTNNWDNKKKHINF